MVRPMASIFERVSRVFRLGEYAPNAIITDVPKGVDQPKKVSLSVEEVGTSGVKNFAGYYDEEYLHNLRGRPAADVYDKMRRSDPKIKMVLGATTNLIKGAQWSVNAADESKVPDGQKHADLISRILFEDLDRSWTKLVGEILTNLTFGYSLFEVIEKPVIGDPQFGNYNSLSKIAWRSPRTIERWMLDHQTGKLLSVWQYAYGDVGKVVEIPAENLLLFTHQKEGDNYEGISALRPCYGSWTRKNLYLKLMAIGIEKFAVPTPAMEVPEGQEDQPAYHNAKKVMRQYTSHEQAFLLYPKGWGLQFAQSNFDAEKIRAAIDKENSEIAFAFLANFLELGQTGSGSYALSNDLSDFYLMGVDYVGQEICEEFNRVLIPNLIKKNFGAQSEYPKLCVSGIKDKPGKELADIMKLLVESKIITPDNKLEDNFRDKYNLPKVSSEGQRQVTAPVQLPQFQPAQSAPAPQAPQPTQASTLQYSERSTASIKFGENPKTPKALIGQSADELRDFMKVGLGVIGQNLIADIMAKKKRATPSQYLNIVNQVEPRGGQKFNQDLKTFLSQISSDAINQARKDIPGGKKIKLTERLASVRLADSPFDKLPKSIQDSISAQVGLLSTFQMQDLLKAIFFQYSNSVNSTDSDDLLEADLQDSLDKYIEGASVVAAAGNSAAKVVNESRAAFYFDEDVIDQIESFTFTNGDPVSPICQDLAGTVFSKDDPNMERYSPPLHHNCKSYLEANLVGSNKQIDPDGLSPSKKSLEKYITLSESNLVVQAIDISKELALSQADAQRIALEFGITTQSMIDSEKVYRIELVDPSTLVEGSLRSVEPMEGVTIFIGVRKVIT